MTDPSAAAPATPAPPRFVATPRARWALALAVGAAFALRLAAALAAAGRGDLEPALGFGFTVIFPTLLLAVLLRLGPTRSREGALMRIGAAAQLVLVVGLPAFALQLLLGLPVVFLMVELFETRAPRRLREPIAAMLVAC
ncbi:MAG: hypothetical protein ABSG83_01540 [Roseiarcus sp.]|jgi:hypothetical protein